MSLWSWIAAAWLIAAVLTTLTFFGAKRSQLIYGWLFGEKPAADVVRLTVAQTISAPAGISRLAA